MFRNGGALALAGLLVLSSASLRAQVETGALVGTVRDSTGAVMDNVEISARHVETNRIFKNTTNATGDYRISQLPTGRYEVAATKSGFRTQTSTGVLVEVSRTLRQDYTLSVGSVSEGVEVTAGAPLLNSENPEVGHVVANNVLQALPTINRDFQALVTLSPGVLPIRGGANSGGVTSGFSARGQRRGDNVIYLDGGVYSQADGFATFTPSLDSLQEFQVKTGLYDAQYGIRPGAQLIAVTKSGTNQLHGSAYNFLQNDSLNARNAFQVVKPEFKQNQYGGTIGGPIYIPKLFNGKDKAWFFFSYQGIANRNFATFNVPVPTAAQKSGVFPRAIIDPSTGQPFANNTIPADRISPVSSKLLQFWPDPNQAGALNFFASSRANFDNRQYIAKIDFATSDNARWWGRLIWDDSPLLGTSPFPVFSTTTDMGTRGVDIGNTWILGPKVVNVALVHFFRRPNVLGQMNPELVPVAATLDINNLAEVPINAIGVPGVSVTGYRGFGGGVAGDVLVGNWEIKDDIAIQSGNHSLKAGVEYKRDYSFFVLGIRGGFDFTGRYSGDPFADFLLGVPSTTSQGGDLQRGNNAQNNWFFYFHDDWNVSPKLTLNLGLRYEYAGAWKDKRGFATNFNPTLGTFVPPLDDRPLGPFESGRYVANAPILEFRKNGLFPRLGLAYRLGRQTVVRGGFALFGNQPDLNTGIGALQQNPRPGTFGKVFIGDPTVPNLSIANPFPTGGPTAPAGVPEAAGAETPMSWTRSYNWGVTVERQLAGNFRVSLGYQGTRNTNLIESVSINDAPPGPGPVAPRRPFPQFGEIAFGTADGKSWYDALTASVEKRAGRDGLFFMASFTGSKSLDNVQSRLSGNIAATGGTYIRSVNMPLSQNKGLSESHIPRRFVFSAGYELPWGPGRPFLNQGPAAKILGGWSLQSLLVLQDGYWFTVALPGDRLNTGSSWSQRPDLIGDPNLPTSERTPARWFNTAAFAVPVGFQYGNAGRGIIESPGIKNLDFAIHRNFSIKEPHNLQFRAEMFNAINHTNLGAPGQQFGTSSFGVIGSALPARTMQLALRYSF